MAPKVKICGITNAADARLAVEAGADMLGLVFYEQSPRFVSVPAAADIAREVPPHIVKVGVFVNAPDEFVFGAISQCLLGFLQFHGDEGPDDCLKFGLMSMKAFRIRDAESLRPLPEYRTDAWLLDTYSANQPGGIGAAFNWDLAVEAQKFGRPIFLAGGLTPQNVAEAVQRVHPFAVDVSSGVESSPGKKDYQKVRDFIAAVRAVP